MNIFLMSWAELRKMRIGLRITLKDAAHFVGVHRVTLSQWERGVRLGDYGKRIRYAHILQHCRDGLRNYMPNLRTKRSTRALDIERVSGREMRELYRRIGRSGISLWVLSRSAGFVPQTLYTWQRCQTCLTREQYTDIINALYDLETGGVYRTLTRSEQLTAIRRLKLYKVNRHKLDELRLELLTEEERGSVHAQSYTQPLPSAGGHSDPVAAHYARLERLRNAIRRYEGKTSPVSEVWARLKNSGNEKDRERCLVLERYYLGGAALSAVSEETGKPERTLYRRKCEVICLTASAIKEGGEKSGEM